MMSVIRVFEVHEVWPQMETTVCGKNSLLLFVSPEEKKLPTPRDKFKARVAFIMYAKGSRSTTAHVSVHMEE